MPNLVGIGNSQVPTNAMLGGLAYQDSVGEIDLEEIKAKTGDTAVDIFVYDTRKDSDGGAWRHRTQHTSWYNEGVSQGRGARKEFPVIAVLATYNNGLRIHDGDDPNLPMWMEAWQYQNDSGAFANTRWWGGSGTANKVVAMNGMIVMGLTLGTRNLHFINDRMSMSYSPASGSYTQRGGVANRNDAQTTSGWDRSDQYYTHLRQHTVNDVAITVLPNSMIDISTGIPNPTIAFAHDSGVTVRKSDFSVVDIYRTNDDDVHFVEFDGDRVIMAMELGAVYVATIPDADQSGNPNSAWTVYGTYSGNTSGTDWPYVFGYGSPDALAVMKNHTFAVSGHVNQERFKGLSITSENLTSPSNGMSAWIRKDSNTGWMHGRVKRALLSSTDSTDLDRTNLMIGVHGNYGSFDLSPAGIGWTLSGAGAFSISGGKLNGNGTSGDSFAQRAETPAVLTTGDTYTVKFTVSNYASGNIRARVGNSSYGPVVSANGTYYHEFRAGSTPTETLLFYGNAFNGKVDDVELYIQDQDRSRNSTGMTVVGTVPRTPVAEGAELMAYGPFNNGYLQQEYSAALDYGTGDFYYMIWINLSGHTPLQGIWSRQDHGQGSGNRIQFQTVGNGDGKLALYSGSNQGDFGNNSKCGIGVWHHIAMVRRSGTMYWYKDGVQFSSYSDTTNYTNTANGGAKLRLGGLNLVSSGQEYTNNAYDMSQGKLALFRTGSTAPSVEQLKKMYYDEKKLFQENAKCSLYGTSNQVTAVAYDDTNDILHAGTSSGRSEFVGLNRINNTTTAVTTAISASDGLVAEQ